jgi:hypothetical protein
MTILTEKQLRRIIKEEISNTAKISILDEIVEVVKEGMTFGTSDDIVESVIGILSKAGLLYDGGDDEVDEILGNK